VAVSVIVPVHNPGTFVEACIESLLGQSLPSDSYEVVFVDDGSTDDTPKRLDEVAAKEPNVRVFHEPASGWAGRPRNIGIDNAVGDYVYFCDHDDWLGPEALERMVTFADAAGADVLDAKTIGHKRGVPRGLYRENEKDATLWTKPLMTSLSPHKMFRRAFLNEHGLRFPEGRRRLEDHVFVVSAYFLAERISVLGDYVCYHHIRREDDSNAAYSLIDPTEYFGYVREVLDIIEMHTKPGPKRDHVLERPFNHEMLGRLSRPRRVGAIPPGYYEGLFREVRTLMLERFPADFAERLSLLSRLRAGLVRDDQMSVLVDLNKRVKTVRGRVVLTSVTWDEGKWRVEIEADAVFDDGSPLRFTPAGDDRWSVDRRLLPSRLRGSVEIVSSELLTGRPSVTAVERSTDEEWFVPSSFVAELREIPGDGGPDRRVVMKGSAVVDPAVLAGGRPLPNGIWDVSVRFGTLGVDLRGRLGADKATARPLPSAAIIGPRPVTVIPYLTETYEKLTFDVGQRVHTLLEMMLARPIGPVEIDHDTMTAEVDVDIAPGASPRSLRLQLIGSDTVVGHCEAAVVADGPRAVLRGGAVPKPASGAPRMMHAAGRYTLGAQSRAKDEPSVVGTVDIDRHGRVIAADFSPAARGEAPPLPRRFGTTTIVDRGTIVARRAAARARRVARRLR
jgi:glycosyltransferase involved in cell wall biosynthesis